MDELLAQFLVEGSELVQQGTEALLALERRPDDRTRIDEAFRAVHTLKGSVGLFDLPPMALALHAAEDLLAAVRGGARAVDRPTIDTLLEVLDQTQAWLGALERGGVLPDGAAAASERLVAELATAATPSPATPSPGAPSPVAPSPVAPSPIAGGAAQAWAAALAADLPLEARAGPLVALRYTPHPGCYFTGDDPLAILAEAPGLVHVRLSRRPAPAADGPYDPFSCDLVIEAAAAAPLTELTSAFRFVADQVAFAHVPPVGLAPPAAPEEGAAGRTLRVDARRVEALAALVDELIAAKSGLAEVVALARSGAAADALAERLGARYGALDRLVGQAHQRVAALRMAPVRPLLRRFPRVVREMAESVGKDVELVVEGDGVEADRNIVEGLFEPLTHLLRNAVDHGVEGEEERRAAGKPPRAVIRLSASEQAGRLHIEVRDDGRGIDPQAIRAAAARRALASAEALAEMDDAAVVELIFLPGFSTAGAVTALSGRGVGMDAIRAAVGRLGGRVSVSSQPGAGAAIHLVLPLTVALTQVMVVSHAEERYGVPVAGVLETVRLRSDQLVPIRAGHAFNWRDRTVPLLALSALTRGAAAAPVGGQRVLVLRAGGQPVGLAVDAIEDRLDVAMRPLEGLLAGMRGVAGTTVMGDGQVLMILDPEALIG